MDIDNIIEQFGIIPNNDDLKNIRDILNAELVKEKTGQGISDTELIKLCCVQLFSGKYIEDTLLIWDAKNLNMDTYASVDIQLLCSNGLEASKEYLKELNTENALSAFEKLLSCEKNDDFNGFDSEEYIQYYIEYYSEDEDE